MEKAHNPDQSDDKRKSSDSPNNQRDSRVIRPDHNIPIISRIYDLPNLAVAILGIAFSSFAILLLKCLYHLDALSMAGDGRSSSVVIAIKLLPDSGLPILAILSGLSIAWSQHWIKKRNTLKQYVESKEKMIPEHWPHSKIKSIYLELPTYSFYHSPYGIKKPDSRFIGRELLRSRLKTILLRSTSKAGAYLITGFRGMGKTSLVRKVLSDITREGEGFRSMFGFFGRMLVILSLNSIFLHFLVNPEGHYQSLSIIFSFAVWLLTYLASRHLMNSDPQRANIRHYFLKETKTTSDDTPLVTWEIDQHKFLWEQVRTFLRQFSFDRFFKSKLTLELISVYYLLTVIVLSITTAWLSLIGIKGRIFWSMLFWQLLFLLIGGLVVFVNERWMLRLISNKLRSKQQTNDIQEHEKKGEKSAFRFWKPLQYGWQGFVRGAKDHLNNRHRIPIEVSLAQEDLKESDVLRILSSRLYSEYKQILKPFFSVHRFVWYFLGWAVILLVTGVVGYNQVAYPIQLDMKRALGLSSYFPSQLIDYRNEAEIHSIHRYFKDHLKSTSGSLTNTNQLDEAALERIVFYAKTVGKDSLEATSVTTAQKACLYLDLWIFSRTWDLLGSSNGVTLPSTTLSLSSAFRFPFFLFDFSFWAILLLVYFMTRIFRSRVNWIGLVNHHYVLRRLEELNESLQSEITLSKSGALGDTPRSIIPFFKLSLQKTRTIPVAGYRQVEEELIEILILLDKIPRITIRPEFIFIFDELDKIHTDYSTGIAEKEAAEIATIYRDEEGISGLNVQRRRKQAIEKILANLKRFFSTAQAKFIFIAGREMYDAALADASDREAFISSIFHEVIYVESFFKDPANKKLADLTGLAEQYVCSFLIPIWFLDQVTERGEQGRYSRTKPCLEVYYQYLQAYVFPDEADTDKLPEQKNTNFQKRKKIIFSLQHFITFLIFRSNGSPKKITKLFEEQLFADMQEELNNTFSNIVVGRNDKSIYLRMNFTDQYRFGFSDYLFKPFLIAKGRHTRDLGDQMLVSTSFLLDHIYKYHASGFSWRHLEQTPEIVSINKAPQLRKFISEMFVFFTNNHLDEILGGLYQFKFNSLISNEISIISKISEQDAASLNFTLDESLQLKKHYKRKIHELRTTQRQNELSAEKEGYLNSIATLNGYLGDLYFYDKEYEDALIHYLEALQSLRRQDDHHSGTPSSNLNVILKMMRITLRIGHTYERMKDYDSAFMAYTKLTRNIRLLMLEQDKKKGVGNLEFSRKEVVEYHRLIFQPLLAKLHVIEKSAVSQMTLSDLHKLEKELKLLLERVNLEEKALIKIEFYRKLAGLLYFKNGRLIGDDFPSNSSYLFSQQVMMVEKANREAVEKAKSKAYSGSNPHPTKVNKGEMNPLTYRDFRVPVTAFQYYIKILALMHQYILDVFEDPSEIKSWMNRIKSTSSQPSEREYLIFFTEFYLKGYSEVGHGSRTKTLLISIARVLSDLGNVMLSCVYQVDDRSINLRDLEILFSEKFSEANNIRALLKLLRDNANPPVLNLVIYFFYLSGQFFKRSARYNKYSFQMKKILILFSRIARSQYLGEIDRSPVNRTTVNPNVGTIDFSDALLQKLKSHIVRECMEVTDRASEFTRRQHLYEYEELLSEDFSPTARNRSLFHDSRLNLPDSREIILLYNEIRLFAGKKSCPRIMTPYSTVQSRITHFWTQNYSVHINEKEFKSEPKSLKKTLYRLVQLRVLERLQLINAENAPCQQEELTWLWGYLGEILSPKTREDLTGNSNWQEEAKDKILEKTQDFLDKWQKSEDSTQSENQDASKKESTSGNRNPAATTLAKAKLQEIEYLICDSINCLTEMAKIAYLADPSYYFNHSLIGNIHHKLGDWCKYFHMLQRVEEGSFDERKVGIKKRPSTMRLRELISQNDIQYLDVGYHYKKAEQHYYLALEMHNEGVSYHDHVLNNMYFLDNDFNDDLYHFHAALERQFINTGMLRRRIQAVKSKVVTVELFNYEDHFGE